MKIKIGNNTITVNALDFLMQCLFSDPERVMRRYAESHEQVRELANVQVDYGFVRRDFIDAMIESNKGAYAQRNAQRARAY